MFSDNSREQVRAASDIVDVIGSYLPLKKAGANFVALCPFHKEKTPASTSILTARFSIASAAIKAAMFSGSSWNTRASIFLKPLRRLADRAKIPLEYEKAGLSNRSRSLKESLLQIHEQITNAGKMRWPTRLRRQIARDYLARNAACPPKRSNFFASVTRRIFGTTPSIGQKQRSDWLWSRKPG